MSSADLNGLNDMSMTQRPLEPELIERVEQPYIGTRRTVSMERLAEMADELPGLGAWLDAQTIPVGGPPFFRYHVLFGSGDLDVEVGFPVNRVREVPGHLNNGVLPGGRFATVTHVGHPRGLVDATACLLDWGAERGLRWDMSETDGGQHWGLRLEIYKTDPHLEPDVDAWETEVLIRLADN